MPRIEIADFRHGFNTKDKSHEILETQTPAIQNIDLSSVGSARTRYGYTKLNSTEITSSTGIFGAFYGKTKHIAASLTNVSYYGSGSYGTDIKTGMTSNAQTYFEEWDNYVYGVNGSDAPWKWDGSSATAITSPHADWTATKPNFVAEHENRLWMFVSSSSKLYGSALDDGDDFTATDDSLTHSFRPNDGFTGTGIVSQQGGLVAFKQQGIFKVTGKTYSAFSFPAKYKTIGCIAPRTIINEENRIFFLAKYKGYYGVFCLDDGGGLHYMSRDIEPELQDITENNEALCSAITYRNKYRITIPVTGGWESYNLNYERGGWEYDSGNPARCYYVVGNALYGGAVDSGYVWLMDSGTNDNGSAITSYVRSKNHMFEAPEYEKQLRYLAVFAKASGSWNLNINFRIDDKLYKNTYTMQLGTKGGSETARWEVIPLPGEAVRGGMISVQFGTSTVDQPFEIYKAFIEYDITNKKVN